MPKKTAAAVVSTILALFLTLPAGAESVSIPLKTLKKPAADLVDAGGNAIDVGRATALARSGQDLSLLNPVENRLWQDRKYPARNTAENRFPAPEIGVRWQSDEVKLPFTYMGRVQSRESTNVYYRFSLSRYSHTTLMRAALLRKLGYFLPSPKYYPRLRVFFKNEDEKKEFLRSVQEAMVSDFESRGWVLEDDKAGHSVVFADALLETQTSEYFDVHWGYAPDPSNPDQLPVVERFSRNRAFRALIVPYSLVDVPESVNRFSPKLGSVLSGHVVLTHPSAAAFQSVAIEDARWLVRRLAALTDQDLREVVREGFFPAELEPLIHAKLVHRVNNAFELFSVRPARALTLPRLDITTSGGLVVDGKVTREFVKGYPQRFSHGDRETPFKDGDFERYLGTRAKTAVIGNALNQINQRLQLLTIGDAVADRQNVIKQRIIDHIRTKPWEPLYQQVEAWGGPVAGVNVNAARHITTGTYYGSNAAIQMVDNLSVAANLGYFVALDGVPLVTTTGGANLQVVRDYTHVRPVMSIEEGSKASWNSLFVPNFMRRIADVLKNENLVAGAKEGDPKRHPLDAFLGELRENEVFTITDSVATSASLRASTSFDVLLGITPLGVLNSVSLSGDAGRVILQQTQIMRTKGGLQIFIRRQKGAAFGLTMDVDYFINLVKIRAQLSKADVKTDAFVIDYDPELSEMVDANADNKFVKDFVETRRDLRPTLLALFRENDAELLYSKFKYKKFEIDHTLKTKELRSRVLIWKSSSFTEDHLLKIRYPRSPEAPELDPKDEEITIFSHKKGALIGRDWIGFLSDVVAGLLGQATKSPVTLNGNDDPNPANAPLGSAEWRLITTDRDLTANPAGGKRYPDVAVLQHVWGGWKLKRAEFFKLIDKIQNEFKGTKLATYRLIEKEQFAAVKSVDFYRVTASLSVLPRGLAKIRDLILQPDAVNKPAPRAPFLMKLAQKLSEGISGHKASAVEGELYRDLMTIMGNGNAERGMGQFTEKCEGRDQAGGEFDQTRSHGGFINGTWFDCMTPWLNDLLNLAREFPKDEQEQIRWVTKAMWVLEEQIPLPQLLKYLGPANYVYLVRINGFRTGDEDGDLEFFSNTIGDPTESIEFANGLVGLFATKTRVSPIELDRTQGSFK